MSILVIFLIGVGVSAICLAGLIFTFVEMGGLGRKSDERGVSVATGPVGQRGPQ